MADKKMTVVDFDDFSFVFNRLDLLYRLRVGNPEFKATVFAPLAPLRFEETENPAVNFPDNWAEWSRNAQLTFLALVDQRTRGWLEIALHGEHHMPLECAKWTVERAGAVLDAWPFAKVFKAPYWEMGPAVYSALLQRDWVLFDHPRNSSLAADYIAKGLRVHLLTDGNVRHVHGHIQDVCGNGIAEMMPQLTLLTNDDHYLFVSETV